MRLCGRCLRNAEIARQTDDYWAGERITAPVKTSREGQQGHEEGQTDFSDVPLRGIGGLRAPMFPSRPYQVSVAGANGDRPRFSS